MLVAQLTYAQIEPIDTDGDSLREVYLLDHLKWISENEDSWSYYYELDTNINASQTRGWNNSAGFSPIGNLYKPFTGKFYGKGFVVDSLYINRSMQTYIGLFGKVMDAEITDLGLTNINYNCYGIAGALIAYSMNSHIADCYSSGNITTESGTAVGGLIGSNYDSYINKCHSLCNIYGTAEHIGGLIGENIEYGNIRNCYSKGNVEGSQYVGGLVGYNYSYARILNSYSTGGVAATGYYVGGLVGKNLSNSQIRNCYSTGNVTSVFGDYIGGLVGFKSYANIITSFSIGVVTGQYSNVGGLIGLNDVDSSRVIACFWDTETSGMPTSDGGVGKISSEMKTKSLFLNTGWNFDFIWDIDTSYPFINFDIYSRPNDTDRDGYLNISDLKGLRWLSESGMDLDENYELDNDIDASDTHNWNDTIGFLPVGNWYAKFSGKFNGNGYKISNLYINSIEASFAGMFGNTDMSDIRNLGLTNVEVKGHRYCGAIVGYQNALSRIRNCYSTGNVTSIHNFVGGLLGYSESNSKVENCYSRANVIGVSDVGGLVGSAGYIAVIFNSYSTGVVTGSSYVGGLLGSSVSAYTTNSFWDKETSGKNSSADGTGLNTSEMKMKSTFTNADWNFVNTWAISSPINDGYPYIWDRTINVIFGSEPADTDGDGYRNISLIDHLVWVSNNDSSWSWNFELDNDINASITFFWNKDTIFKSIGNTTTNFTGKFNGNGYKIDSLYIYNVNNGYMGLFGYTNNAEIENLGVTNTYIKATNYIGGLVGYNYNSIINKCYTTGNLIGVWDYVGGLIGMNSTNSKISNCYSRANVKGSSIVGGLIGDNYNNYPTTNCYSTGYVDGSLNYIGGLIGLNYQSTVLYSFWDKETSGMVYSAEGLPKSTALMKTKSTFTNVGWDFVNNWNIDAINNNGYPYLIFQNADDIIKIPLKFGWNLISSNIKPNEPDSINNIMSSLGNKVIIVKNGLGATYIPQYNINNIGKWNSNHGYYIYMNQADTLEIQGKELEPSNNSIQLNSGWNTISYLRNSELNADNAFGTLIPGNLIIVKTIDGQSYIPAYNINNIGNLLPGVGYKIYVNQGDTLTYPDN